MKIKISYTTQLNVFVRTTGNSNEGNCLATSGLVVLNDRRSG